MKVKAADPEAPVVSVAVTVTALLSAAVGVPEMRPVAEPMDKPRQAGNVFSVCPDAESDADICRLTAVPTEPVWLPGLVTVTILAAAEPTVQVTVAEPDGPVVSVPVRVTL